MAKITVPIEVDVDSISKIITAYLNENEDVVEVVRCKNCKNWEDDWNPESVEKGRHFCCMIGRFPDGDFYCPDGERKEE